MEQSGQFYFGSKKVVFALSTLWVLHLFLLLAGAKPCWIFERNEFASGLDCLIWQSWGEEWELSIPLAMSKGTTQYSHCEVLWVFWPSLRCSRNEMHLTFPQKDSFLTDHVEVSLIFLSPNIFESPDFSRLLSCVFTCLVFFKKVRVR